MTMDALTFDVRAGMTSASNALADRLCPGRHFAQRGVETNPESKDSRIGTLIHKAFTGATVDLDRSQRKTLNRGRFLEFEMVRRFYNEALLDEDIMQRAHREQRYWAHVRSIPVHSGQVDAVWISADWKSALIEDLKALFGDVQDATENEQLRDEAALFYENFGVESVTVFINQPNVRWKVEDQKMVTYGLEDLKQAHAEMMERVAASNSIEAARIPGLEQCKFCRAAGTHRCPESQSTLTKGWAHAFDAGAATAGERGKWIAEMKRVESTAKKLVEHAKDKLKEDPAWAEGWKIGEGRVMREITQPIEVWRRVMEYFDNINLAEEMLHETAKISVPKLQEWFTAAVGGDERAARDAFNLMFESLIETKTSEGSLVKAK